MNKEWEGGNYSNTKNFIFIYICKFKFCLLRARIEKGRGQYKIKMEMTKAKLINKSKNEFSRKFVLENKDHCHHHIIIKYKYSYQKKSCLRKQFGKYPISRYKNLLFKMFFAFFTRNNPKVFPIDIFRDFTKKYYISRSKIIICTFNSSIATPLNIILFPVQQQS